MKSYTRLLLLGGVVLGLSGLTSTATADIIGVSGPVSSSGAAAAIIPAPSHALDSMVTNLGQEGFDEKQGVFLVAPLAIDGGAIPAGTTVNSHMIFLNSPGPSITHTEVVWEFANPIIGIMSDFVGALEVASTPILGAPGTIYPGATFAARGMEGGDVYSLVTATKLKVGMGVSQPGDWIRVITIPAPGAALLAVMGIGMVGAIRRRRQA